MPLVKWTTEWFNMFLVQCYFKEKKNIRAKRVHKKKNIHSRETLKKKNSCGSKIPRPPPPHNFSKGPSLMVRPLQQRSSNVTWNYTWNLSLLKSPGNPTPYITLTLHFSQHDREFLCLLQYFARLTKLAASQADLLRSACSLAIITIIIIISYDI